MKELSCWIAGQPQDSGRSPRLHDDEAECKRDDNLFRELIHVRLTSMRLAFRPGPRPWTRLKKPDKNAATRAWRQNKASGSAFSKVSESAGRRVQDPEETRGRERFKSE